MDEFEDALLQRLSIPDNPKAEVEVDPDFLQLLLHHAKPAHYEALRRLAEQSKIRNKGDRQVPTIPPVQPRRLNRNA